MTDVGKRLRKVVDRLKVGDTFSIDGVYVVNPPLAATSIQPPILISQDQMTLTQLSAEDVRATMAILRENLSVLQTINRNYDEKFVEDKDSGISIRVVQQFNAADAMVVPSLDVLYGTARIIGDDGATVARIPIPPPLPVLGAPRLYNCDDVAVAAPVVRRKARVPDRRIVSARELIGRTQLSRSYFERNGYYYNSATDEFIVPPDVDAMVMSQLSRLDLVAQQQISLGAPRAYFND